MAAMTGIGTLACYSYSVVVHDLVVHVYSSVLHVLSTPRFDTERLEWREDTMRFDTVVY